MTSHAARGLDVEDTAAISMRFECGAIGTFVLSDVGASPWAFEAATAENPAIHVRGDDPLRFIGTKGSLGCPSLDVWTGTGANDWQHTVDHQPGPKMAKVDAIAVQIDRFAAMVGGGADDLLATGKEGRRTMCVLDAIARSVESGKTQKINA